MKGYYMRRLFCPHFWRSSHIAHVGGLRAVLGPCGAVMGAPFGQFSGVLGRLGALLGRLGALSAVWGVSWGRLGAFERPSQAALGLSGGPLGPA